MSKAVISVFLKCPLERNRSRINFLTKIFCDPGSPYLSYPSGKLVQRCAFRFLTHPKQLGCFECSFYSPSRGIEPLLRDPQSRVLSVERRGQKSQSQNFQNLVGKKFFVFRFGQETNQYRPNFICAHFPQRQTHKRDKSFYGF